MRIRPPDKLSDPRSIAVLGASATEGHIDFALVENFIEVGFTGNLFRYGIPLLLPFQRIRPEPIDIAVCHCMER